MQALGLGLEMSMLFVSVSKLEDCIGLFCRQWVVHSDRISCAPRNYNIRERMANRFEAKPCSVSACISLEKLRLRQ